jgi:hypothetical protein
MSAADVELITPMYLACDSADIKALMNVLDADVEVRPAPSAFLSSRAP